jgi:hypothetical protein
MKHTIVSSTVSSTACAVEAEKQNEEGSRGMRELSVEESEAVAGGSGYLLSSGRSQDGGCLGSGGGRATGV